MRERTRVYQVGKMLEEIWQALALGRKWKATAIICSSNPHIPHEQWETDHDCTDTKRASKLEVIAVVDFRVRFRGKPFCDLDTLRFFLGRTIGQSIGRPVDLKFCAFDLSTAVGVCPVLGVCK